MQYFKHSDLANEYHVSLKTIHNWIVAAKTEKVKLDLHETKSGTYIAKTAQNTRLLESLAEKGKKYRNLVHHKIVEPSDEFYRIYDKRQTRDIINNIEVHREIPRQYNYVEGGAENWDKWLKHLATEDNSNILQGTLELFRDNLHAFDRLIENKTRVNIVDLGVGNAYPVREFLGHILKSGKLNRYIGIDISQAMLDIAGKNINEWYDGEVAYEGHLRDFTYERFDDLLVDDMLGSKAKDTINIVLLLGGTSGNFRSFTDVFKTVYGSLGVNDVLIYADKLDTETSRKYFNFSTAVSGSSIVPGMSKLSPNYKYILDLMNLDESLYSVEAGFDPARYMRYVQIRLSTSITIQFKTGDASFHEVRLEKGEALLLLRVWHRTALQYISDFEKTGFMLLHSSLTKNREYFLSISGIESKKAKEI